MLINIIKIRSYLTLLAVTRRLPLYRLGFLELFLVKLTAQQGNVTEVE